jgi:transposase
MKTMPKNILEERYRWIKPILDKNISIKQMSLVCPFSQRTLKRWLKRYRKNGMMGLSPLSRRPKTSPRETPIRVKERVLELRKETRLCALKLKWDLAEENICLSTRVIGKYIKQEGLTRRYRTKKIKYNYIKIPLMVGELVEIDVKWVPERIDSKRYFQFTAIDCSSRWRFLEIYDDLGTNSALDFLDKLIKIFPGKIKAIKTDNGSYFTNRYVGYQKSIDPLNPRIHPFDLLCGRYGILHYLIDPGKPAQNGKVERSHRTDQESFYDNNSFKTEKELKLKLKLWNMYYNDLKHCGLNGLTPNQALRSGGTNVCA